MTFPIVLNSAIGRHAPGSEYLGFPCFFSTIVRAPLNCCGKCPSAQHAVASVAIASASLGPIAFKNPLGIPFFPKAVKSLRLFKMAFTSSLVAS